MLATRFLRYVLAGLAIIVIPSVYTIATGAITGGAAHDHFYVRIVIMMLSGCVCAAAAVLAWLVPIRRERAGLVLVVYAAAAFVLVSLQDAAATTLMSMLPAEDNASNLANMRGPFYFPYIVLVHMFIAGNAVKLASRVRERDEAAEQLDRSLAEARLHMLELQLDPVDVVQALGRIKQLTHIHPAEAIAEIAELGERLRERLALIQES